MAVCPRGNSKVWIFFTLFNSGGQSVASLVSWQQSVSNREIVYDSNLCSQLAFTCSDLTIEKLEQVVKYVQS